MHARPLPLQRALQNAKHTQWPTNLQACSKQRSPGPQHSVVVQALQIDRRRHLELLWERQQAEEALQQQQAVLLESQPAQVPEVQSLAHLERLLEAAGSRVVVLYLYTKSCGNCKEILRQYTELARDAASQKAGIRFLKHNVWDEYDYVTDVARFYCPRSRVPDVPAFAFFVDGALVRTVRMADSRNLTGTASAIQLLMSRQHSKLQAVLRQMLWENTPSARR